MTTFCIIMRCWNIFLTDLDWKSMSKEETATFEMMWKSIFIYTMVMHVNSIQHPVLWIKIRERHWLRHINKRHINNCNAQQQDFQISLCLGSCIYKAPAVSQRRNIETVGCYTQDVNQMENKSNAVEAVNRWLRSEAGGEDLRKCHFELRSCVWMLCYDEVWTASGCVVRSAGSLQELLHSHAFYPEQS